MMPIATAETILVNIFWTLAFSEDESDEDAKINNASPRS